MKSPSFLAFAVSSYAAFSLSASAVEIANSETEFSGVQGDNGWTNGYRNYTQDGGGEDYDANSNFIAFLNDDSSVPETDPVEINHWNGAKWDFEANPPWTEIAAVAAHPNGTNNAEEHWCIRRWSAAELTGPTPIAITWHVRKNAVAGGGVGGSLHVNGVQVDTAATTTIAGVTRTVFVNADPADVIDLALTPVGPTGDRLDGNDGSSFTMVIDDEVNDLEVQPDGSPFFAIDSPDTDGDSLPDSFEEFYAPGDLDALSGLGGADNDADGVDDLREFNVGTNPVHEDTDDDGLEDGQELDDTETDPLNADTDGDGRNDGDEVNGTPGGAAATDPFDPDSDDDTYSDGEEVLLNSDPNDIDDTPLSFVIADSLTEWTGTDAQGPNWSYGYRNYTADGGGDDYAASAITLFDPASEWRGNGWRIVPSNAPWTFLQQQNTHPNGTNSAPNEEHWTVRRWSPTAAEVPTTTPLAIVWHTRKGNTNGDGVTGSIHHNGVMLDSQIIPGADTTGVVRIAYANVNPGDALDLALSPAGETNRSDGSDGSANWMRIDTRIPANPVQPDGSAFVPATGEDTDGDGLPDAWEEGFFPGDLTQLSGQGGADKDMDGLTDAEEFTNGTDPTDTDSDDDTLLDGAEVNEHETNPKSADTDGDGRNDADEINGGGGFVTDPTDPDSDDDNLTDGAELATHGTDPTELDTDGDGDNDGYEVNRRFDPNDPEINSGTLLADSFEGFSQVQGQDNWNHGYRNFTQDGGVTESYDVVADFVPFDENTEWRPNWRLVPTGAPWTFLAAEDTHPNGSNNVDEHWTIRRWTASDLTAVTPLALRWHARKSNTNGSGVTGALYINGSQVDTVALAGPDSVGVVRTWYANVMPDDVVDLTLSAVGPDGDTTDGADGSVNWLRVDTRIPSGAQQPDGTPFVPAGAGGLSFISVVLNEDASILSVTFPSTVGRTYALDTSTGLEAGGLLGWSEVDDSIPGETEEMTIEVSIGDPHPPRFFVRVRDVTE